MPNEHYRPILMTYDNFAHAIHACTNYILEEGEKVHTLKWQGVRIKDKPEMAMYEVNNLSFTVPMQFKNIEELVYDVEPNIPWAEDHFQERVSGVPLNPGNQWKNWPWGHSANRFRSYGVHADQFSHTYMERYWPKRANDTGQTPKKHNRGVRFNYGDLNDVVSHLISDPYSRQAYLPIFFPEDTGVLFKGRVPCTLGYHFLQRAGELHITYYIRSCDLVRHFRDDIYMTVRLAMWVLNRLHELGVGWSRVELGNFTMHIANLHCFVNDYQKLKNG